MPRIAAKEIPIPNLQQALYALTNEKLRWYAGALPGRIPTRKAELVEHIASVLTRPEEVKKLVLSLTPIEQNALAEIVHRYGGIFDEQAISAKYPAVNRPRSESELYKSYYSSFSYGTRKEDSGPASLEMFLYYSRGLGWCVPSDMAGIIRELTQPQPAMPLTGHKDPPGIAHPPRRRSNQSVEQYISRGEEAVFHDLAATLALVAESKVSVGSTTRLPSLPTVRTLRDRLMLPELFEDQEYGRADDSIRTQALVMIVQAANWAAPPGTGSKLQLTKAGNEVMSQGVGPAQVKEAWARWLKSNLLDELSRVNNIKGQQSNTTQLTRPAQRHQAIAEALRALPEGSWVTMEDFARYILSENLLREIELNYPSGLYIGSSYYGSLYDVGTYWDIVVGSYVRAVLMEYVSTFGIIEIAYTKPEYSTRNFDDIPYIEFDYLSRYDGLSAIKLTGLGAYVLGLASTYVPSIQPGEGAEDTQGLPLLKVLPTLEIVITDAHRLMPNEKVFLERIAKAQSEHVYRLNCDLLMDALDKRINLVQVRKFLAAKSGINSEDLPNTVLTFFDDVERRANILIDAGKMLVFESTDPYLLAELSTSPGLRGVALLGKIGKKDVLFIPESHEKDARKLIRKLGYAPRKDRAPR